MTGAACRGVPHEVFFVVPGAPASKAREFCGVCPVAAECLADALEHGDGGIRAGLTQDQRRGMGGLPKRRSKATCGTDAGYYRHLRILGEPACPLCREAHAAAWRMRKRASA